MSRRRLFSIAPHGRFLEVLADGVLDGTLLSGWERSGPFWLSDVTIFLPTRRARLRLAEIFAERNGGAAVLPDIRSLGADPDESEEPFLPPIDAPSPPPVATRLERRLTLSRLVDRFARLEKGFASPPNAAEILWLADSLGELIDDLSIEGVSIGKLKELMPEELAANWQDILTFLDIALKAWPKILRDRDKVDAAPAQNERLGRQAQTVRLLYGDRPVIAAGSTGSIPATAKLLGAIARLKRGAIVLPGLDVSLSAEQHAALLDGTNLQGHPQYGLAKLLRALGAGIAEVDELAGQAPRTSLLRAALAPADETRSWPDLRGRIDVAAALADVAVLAAPNTDLEARAIAVRARAALVERRTIGIVSRDQTLARRIAAELHRFGIDVDDPAGTPLFQSPAGRLARRALAVIDGNFAPLDVIALLQDGATTMGRDRAEVRSLAESLDLDFRGKRPLPGLAGLLALAGAEGQSLLEALGELIEPLRLVVSAKQVTAPILAAELKVVVDGLVSVGDLPGLEEFRRWADELASLEDAGPAFPPENLHDVLAALMAGAKVTGGERRRDDIHIWGELEARLQSPDLMILAGVNEDSWPPAADPGPWMSRKMRIDIGLEPPERQQGQAAHDFEMAMGTREVVIAYAERVGTAPALPSRFVQRLDAFAGEDIAAALRAKGEKWLLQALLLDAADPPAPARRPVPCPAARLRPRRLSVTEIETLIRSPYDLYAKHVLRLRRIDPLGQMPEAKERGTMIHEIFAKFVEDHDVDAPNALAELMRLAQVEFAGLEAIAGQRDIWVRRFERSAEQLLDYERGRESRVERRHAERRGRHVFKELDHFELRGVADRLDYLRDGGLEIIDFKTGTVPSTRQMQAFEAPQLLLEAQMAALGAFEPLEGRQAQLLTYIKIGLGPRALTVTPFKTAEGLSLEQMITRNWERTQAHIEALLIHDNLPMAARIRPDINRRYAGDYDHLARTDEWTLTAGIDR